MNTRNLPKCRHLTNQTVLMVVENLNQVRYYFNTIQYTFISADYRNVTGLEARGTKTNSEFKSWGTGRDMQLLSY